MVLARTNLTPHTDFSPTSGYSELAASDCTSCGVTQDKSAYWTPPLYFKHADTGKFEIVEQVGGLLAYYFLNYNSGENKVTAFPEGFAMIAGDTNQRSFTGSLESKAIGFNCMNYGRAPEGTLYRHSMPDKAYLDANCADGIRVELMFPACWNGKDLDSPNHRSHVAYPDGVMTGNCPPEFPVRFPGLMFEIIWNTNAFNGKAGEFVWSNGDPTGYGYHGDFIMGWESGVLQKAADTCTNPSGVMADCPVFKLQTEADSQRCQIKVPGEIANEDIEGPLDALPGGAKVNYGPAYNSPGVAPGPAPSAALPPVPSYKAGSSVAPSETPVPGGIFVDKGGLEANVNAVVPSSEPAPPPAPEPTPEPKPTPKPEPKPLAANQKLYTTSYKTDGNEVVEIVMIEEFVTVTETPVTMTEWVTVPGRRKRHLHRHAAGHA
jgi:hypothetical protein